jgi:IclR family transcriptional regulator, pca regulon regulatory protein
VGASPRRPQRKVPTLREPRYSQSVERGLAILKSFTGEPPILGIADIADHVGMSRSTVHRYVITFVALGFLKQGAARKYRLGPGVIDLGMSALGIAGMRGGDVRTHLKNLRRRTSHTTALAVLDGVDVVCVEHARSYRQSEGLLWLNVRPGRRLPAYCTAMGKVLLACLDRTELKRAIGEIKFVRHTDSTIRSRAALSKAVREVRERHFAVADEEFLDGLIEIAVPVLDKSGDCLGALGLLANNSTGSLNALVDDFFPLLAVAADGLSAKPEDN